MTNFEYPRGHAGVSNEAWGLVTGLINYLEEKGIVEDFKQWQENRHAEKQNSQQA